jgi:hypothetical protein
VSDQALLRSRGGSLVALIHLGGGSCIGKYRSRRKVSTLEGCTLMLHRSRWKMEQGRLLISSRLEGLWKHRGLLRSRMEWSLLEGRGLLISRKLLGSS